MTLVFVRAQYALELEYMNAFERAGVHVTAPKDTAATRPTGRGPCRTENTAAARSLVATHTPRVPRVPRVPCVPHVLA